MTHFRPAFIFILILSSFVCQAQTVQLIGTSEENILENVKGYPSVNERALEHEEFNVLVFEDQDRELSFYFTFYRGDKVCNYIKNKAPLSVLKEEIKLIKANLKNIRDNIWENSEKTAQVEIRESNGIGFLIIKQLR